MLSLPLFALLSHELSHSVELLTRYDLAHLFLYVCVDHHALEVEVAYLAPNFFGLIAIVVVILIERKELAVEIAGLRPNLIFLTAGFGPHRFELRPGVGHPHRPPAP